MTWAKGDLRYCATCRARHEERDRGRGVDFPRCEKEEGMCEMLMGAPPFRLHPDNWLPIAIYERAIGLSPMEIVTIPTDKGSISLSHRSLSMEALRFALEDYADFKYSRDWILDSISIIQSIFDEAMISKAK